MGQLFGHRVSFAFVVIKSPADHKHFVELPHGPVIDYIVGLLTIWKPKVHIPLPFAFPYPCLLSKRQQKNGCSRNFVPKKPIASIFLYRKYLNRIA